MSERDDALVERVMQQVDHPGLEDPGLDLRGDERRLWREYGELAGLLPLALEPEEPPAGQIQRILAALPRDRRDVAHPDAGSGVPPVAHQGHGVLALAAAVTVAALGLALVCGWLWAERGRQAAAITELETRLATSLERERALEQSAVELSRMRAVFTSATLRVCPLRPWGASPSQPVARAVVYLDGERQRWFLAARDLEPCRQGSHYVLWFVVDGKPVPAGSFRPEKGVPVAISEKSMPGESSGVFLTLEPDPTVETPTGPPILYGEDPEEML